MALTLDPGIARVLEAQEAEARASGGELPERGDWRTLRRLTDEAIESDFLVADEAPDVSFARYDVPVEGGSIEVRWYSKRGSAPGSAIVYAHGGGMISGSLDNYDPLFRQYVQHGGVPFLAVGYRLAPEFTGETPARDVFAAVQWLTARTWLGIEPQRIALMGDSAGGGVAAGAAILARAAGVPLAAQILVYPMLDDRNVVPDPCIAPLSTWTYEMNYTGWHALLGDDLGSDRVSAVAAPARLQDFAGLPPTYIEVGTLDIFRDESIDYAQRLLLAGVDTELHVHVGSPHGHEWTGHATPLAARCWADRFRVISKV